MSIPTTAEKLTSGDEEQDSESYYVTAVLGTTLTSNLEFEDNAFQAPLAM